MKVPEEMAASRNPIASALIGGELMIGDNPLLNEIKAYILKVAPTDSSVLITGETGTGKELVAQLIHNNSPRCQRPMVCINCAAIPDSLLESELFGHEKGAFTGAHSSQEGRLKLAEAGTVFFDEIGDMSPHAQAKILRTLESKEVYRLGGKSSIHANIRVVAATNQDLDQLTDQGKFRKDLFFRLNVARIVLPPLRSRKEDIPQLLAHFIGRFNRLFDQQVEGIDDQALQYLLRHDWPGNVRELKNLLEATFLGRPSRRIMLTDLPEKFRLWCDSVQERPLTEQERLLAALYSTNWNKSKAAQRLHWSRMTLYRKIAKYQLRPEGH
jgi:transcriptional regulator with PAS, ATPase and Fis domain